MKLWQVSQPIFSLPLQSGGPTIVPVSFTQLVRHKLPMIYEANVVRSWLLSLLLVVVIWSERIWTFVSSTHLYLFWFVLLWTLLLPNFIFSTYCIWFWFSIFHLIDKILSDVKVIHSIFLLVSIHPYIYFSIHFLTIQMFYFSLNKTSTYPLFPWISSSTLP